MDIVHALYARMLKRFLDLDKCLYMYVQYGIVCKKCLFTGTKNAQKLVMWTRMILANRIETAEY